MMLLSPEHRVLLCCAREGPETYRDVKLREALSQVTDWHNLRQTALNHAVYPSLYRCLTQVAPEVLHPAFLQEIQGLYRAQAHCNLRITGELLGLLAFFERQGVEVLPFKGPVLAQLAYGDLTMRRFVDLDLLVHEGDIPKVKKLCLSLGYQLEHAYTTKQEEVCLRNTCEFSFSHPRRTILDVHWRFAPNCLGGGPNVHKAFARRVPVNLMGKTLSTLSPLDHLLVLCLHGFNPCVNLSQISDMAMLIKSQTHWDWEVLLYEAEAGRMRRTTLLGLSLAHDILGAPVPPHITALAAKDHAVTRLRRQVWQSLFSYTRKVPGLFSSAFYQGQTQDRLRDKFNYIWIGSFVPTVQDWRWISLPDSRYWLYYFLRPLRLFIQGVLGALRNRRSREE
jgi:hypothetical protein